jgi:hypothetical protein
VDSVDLLVGWIVNLVAFDWFALQHNDTAQNKNIKNAKKSENQILE